MDIATFGSAGMGLVWGWLVGLYSRPSSHQVGRPGLNWLVLAFFTLLLTLQTLLFLGWRGVVIFLASAACGLMFHLAWLQSLRGRSS